MNAPQILEPDPVSPLYQSPTSLIPSIRDLLDFSTPEPYLPEPVPPLVSPANVYEDVLQALLEELSSLKAIRQRAEQKGSIQAAVIASRRSAVASSIANILTNAAALQNKEKLIEVIGQKSSELIINAIKAIIPTFFSDESLQVQFLVQLSRKLSNFNSDLTQQVNEVFQNKTQMK